MAEYTGSFDTGVAGATVLAADSGSLTAWSDKQTDANGTLAYSATQKYGELACQMILSATPSGSYVAWTSAVLGTSLTSLWGRIYMHHSGLPNTVAIPVRGFDILGSGVLAWQINISSSGLVSVRDTGGTTRGTGSVPIATGQWIRLEFHVVSSVTAGVIEVKLFNNADSVTETETITSTGSFSTLSRTDLLRFGEIGGINASRTIYMDNILVNDTGYPGPLYGSSYHSNVQGDAPALYWKLDEAAGNFENSGTLGVLYPVSLFNGNYGYREEPAVGENYSTLNGSGASLNNNMTFTDPNVWTLEAWVKPTAIPPTGSRGIIELGFHAPCLRVDGTTQRLELVKSSVSTDGFSTAPIEIGKWQHVVARRTGSVSTLFINGIDRSGTMSNPTYEQSGQATGFGGQWVVRPDGGNLTPNSEFIGFIDEVAIYDYALTDARILAHYKAGIPSGFTADFERGAIGSLVGVADPGSATKWDAFNQAGFGTLNYDNTHVYTGTKSAKVITPGQGSTLQMEWNTFPPLTEHYGRVYIYMSNNPDGDFRWMEMTGLAIWPRSVVDGGILRFFTGEGFAGDMTIPYAVGRWIRVEWHVVCSNTAGVVEARLFNDPNSTVPTDTFTASNRNTGTSLAVWRFGDSGGGSTSALTYWMDNIVVGATAWAGPVSLTSPQGMLPTQHGGGMGKW